MHELAFRPQRGDSRPLYRQLADYLSELIRVGRWSAGMKLPSTRVVAEGLGISRTTANLAYECLRDEGHVTSHVGQGTFVRAASEPPPTASEASYAWGGLLASRVKALGIESLRRAVKPGRSAEFDFRGGRVDPSLLPARTLRQHFAQAFSSEGLQEFANELDPQGWPTLRQHIAASLLARGLRCHADQVVVTSGGQAGLDLISRVLLEPGDVVAMEEPGYFGAHLALRAAQAEWVGVRVDRQGIDVDALARLLRRRRVKLLYVTPAVQSPTGAQLSPDRRRALLELAAEHQLPILEDDYDNELRHSDEPVTALASEASHAAVLYVGTFSKVLFPSLRLGYVVVPEALVPAVSGMQLLAQFAPSALMQRGLCSLLTDEGLARHVRRVRIVYARRIEVFRDAVSQFFPAGTRAWPPAGGNQIWVELPDAIDPVELHTRAFDAGIAYTPGSFFFRGPAPYHAASFSVACADEATIANGIARLGALVTSAPTH